MPPFPVDVKPATPPPGLFGQSSNAQSRCPCEAGAGEAHPSHGEELPGGSFKEFAIVVCKSRSVTSASSAVAVSSRAVHQETGDH
eukprot:3191236-Rhodomonas_salina.1